MENLEITRIWIGLDDTDTPDYGCTTATFDDLINSISHLSNFRVLERRLVRLWPFAERRTRGNGALSCIIECSSESILEFESLLSIFFSNLEDSLQNDGEIHPQTSPALVYSFEQINEDFYWEAVRQKVDISDRIKKLSGIKKLTINSDWGLIGASSAMAWKSNDQSTWELISWRYPKNIGEQRKISSAIVKEMEINHPETFVNRDPTKEKGLIAPRTPCPVLYGIRGSTSESVLSAHKWLQSNPAVEKCQRFAIHRTNQLSDDHIRGFSTSTVLTKPVETKGAHSSLEVTHKGNRKTLVAFKEGGDVNRLLRKLIPGDRINWLGLESPDGSIHLERLRIESSVPRILGRPICCNNKTMRSAGVNQPLRCLFCQKVAPKHWVFENINLTDLELTNGWVEPSPSQRRHLSRPLSLGEPVMLNLN